MSRKLRKKSFKIGNERPEPDYKKLTEGHEEYDSELMNALNYANYVFTKKDCKDFARTYAKENLDLMVTVVPEWEFTHIGAICWLLSNGAYIEDVEGHDQKIRDLVEHYEQEKEEKADNVVKIDTTQRTTDILIGELEGIIDDVVLGEGKVTNPIELYKKAKKFKEDQVRDYFQRQLDDIMSGGEGYDGLDKDYLKRVKLALTFILKQLDEYKDVKVTRKKTKAVRVQKAKKIVPAKMVMKLKYKKEDDEYKIKSVLPSSIVQKDVLWVFNTKNKRMTQFVAADKTGLLVKGTTITNFDVDKSQEKKLRKPEEFLTKLSEAGKVEQRTLLDSESTVGKCPKGRLNDHCVLVKTY